MPIASEENEPKASTAALKGSRSFRLDVLHLFVLSSFAFAQPIYDVLGKHVEFFVARNVEPLQIALFVLTLSVLLPACIALCLSILKGLGKVLGRAVYEAGHTLLLGALVAVAALPLVKKMAFLPAIGMVVLALVVATLFVLAYRKYADMRSWLSVLSLVLIVFPAFFVFATPVTKVAFPNEVSTQDDVDSLSNPVVMLVFDMFPITAIMNEDQTIDAHRYPNFARLAQDAHWYRQATTVAISTATAVPSIVTGRYPEQGTLPVIADHPGNLFTVAGSRENLNVFESITRLCPSELCVGEDQGGESDASLSGLMRDTWVIYQHTVLPEPWTRSLPAIDGQWHDFGQDAGTQDDTNTPEDLGTDTPDQRDKIKKRMRADSKRMHREDRVEKLRTFLSRLENQTERGFSYLHLPLPHGPFEYLPSGTKYIPSQRKYRKLRLSNPLGKIKIQRESSWGESPYLVELAYRRMLFQTTLADSLLGELLDRLQELGMYERSLLIVVADHGQTYEVGSPLRNLSEGDTFHVPLFVKPPGQGQGMIDDRNAEIVDIVPTAADVLGIELPWTVEGQSLLTAPETERSVKRVFDPKGGYLELPWPSTTLEISLAKKLTRVQSGTDSETLFAFGPHPELIGKSLADPSSGLEVTVGQHTVDLHLKKLMRKVDLQSGFVPAYLTGKIELAGPTQEPLDLALAIHGTIQATGQSFETPEGSTEFAFLVPESVFVDGKNPWQIYTLEELGAGRLRLEQALPN